MNDYVRRLAALVASLTFITFASCENKAPPNKQKAAAAKEEGKPKQPSAEQKPPAPTQASETQQASKDGNADSGKSAPADPTLRANAKGFKTAQECFAVFAALTDSD